MGIMSQSTKSLELRCTELEKQLLYYKKIAEKAEQTRLKEIKILNQQIAERKKAEQELLKAEKKMRSWLEVSPICTKILDRHFRLQYMSSVGIVSLKIDDITKFYGQKFPLDCYPEPTRISIINNLEKIRKTGGMITLETPVFDMAGEELWFQSTFKSVTDKAGQCDYIIVASINMTDQKRVEETQTKLEKQLRQAQTMKSLGLMAGGVAHDLNNILSGIVGYPDLILNGMSDGKDLRELILAIKNSGERAATVVADLLTIARGAASARERRNLNEIITEFLNSPECKNLKKLYPDITWQNRLDSKMPYISCSPVHINKCIVNLVTNAAEAIAESGSINITTSNQCLTPQAAIKLDMKAGDYSVLEVRDTGKGLPEEEKELIFEPFYTNKVLGRSGTGLGLTVVWNTVNEHGGKIIVESDSAGTSFKLFFPIAEDQKQSQEENCSIEDFAHQQGHILIVDDDSQILDIASRMLVQLGYTVDSVSSGEQAVEFLKEQSVDLILLDMLMEPGMNGYQTYKKIVIQKPRQKAIITSGFSESTDVKAAVQLGVHGFLKKPYAIEQLGKLVKEALAS